MSEVAPFVVEDGWSGAPVVLHRSDEAEDLGGLVAAAARVVARGEQAASAAVPPSGEIQLFDPSTGVVTAAVDARRLLSCAGLVDPDCEDIEAALADVPFEALVTFAAKAAELASVVKEADNAVRHHLPLRLDKLGEWTVRAVGYVVNSPSETAGTSGYDSALLRSACGRLVDEGVIEQEAADRALEVVPVPALVPYAMLRLILDALDGELDQPGYAELREQIGVKILDEPEPRLVQHRSGIVALRKLRAARPVIEACEVPLTPPRRKATVKPAHARPGAVA